MIRVFIGYDPKEPISYSVLAHSILRRASEPTSITPVALNQIAAFHARERNALQSTEFSFSRFLVPYLCDFEGWAIFLDCDQLMLADIADLWKLRDDFFAVMCVKHDHKPKEATKFLGQVQTSYPMKNWSSVMLMNCARCTALSPSYVNTASGLDLHRFNWLKAKPNTLAATLPNGEDRIGELPPSWNHLVGYDAPTGHEKNLHFTEGGPWFKEYEDVPYAGAWRAERNAAFGAFNK